MITPTSNLVHFFPPNRVKIESTAGIAYKVPNCSLVFCAKSGSFLVIISHNKLMTWQILGRSLMIGWRKNSWNPERVPTVVTFVSVCLSVCVSVRPRAAGDTFWHRTLIFGLSDPWDMRKKRIFLFFEIFIFTPFIGIFRFFPYITLVNFWF